MKKFWKEYIIAGILTTIGYFFVYQKITLIPNWSVFLMWIPVVWLLLLGLALMVGLFLNLGEKK